MLHYTFVRIYIYMCVRFITKEKPWNRILRFAPGEEEEEMNIHLGKNDGCDSVSTIRSNRVSSVLPCHDDEHQDQHDYSNFFIIVSLIAHPWWVKIDQIKLEDLTVSVKLREIPSDMIVPTNSIANPFVSRNWENDSERIRFGERERESNNYEIIKEER